MQVSLSPDVRRFIDEQVKAGRYPSPEAVIEAAITELRESGPELDDATIAAIHQADDEAERGGGADLDEFRSRISKRFRG